MEAIKIANTDLRVSRFIFGTGSLFNAGPLAKRLAVLEAAVEHGFTHFDAAPYYGFGMAERDLAHVLRKHRALTVTTKVGIYPPGGEQQSTLSILFRKAGGKVFPALSRPTVDFSLQRAQWALEGSLRRLGRDCIDVYMLHEPLLELVNTDEWLKWLEDLCARGRIRYFGLALTIDRLLPFLKTKSPLADFVQTVDSLRDREADVLPAHGKPLQITYGYVSAARAKGDMSSVADVLSRAVKRNAHGAIIVSTRQPGRMGQYRALLESGS